MYINQSNNKRVHSIYHRVKLKAKLRFIIKNFYRNNVLLAFWYKPFLKPMIFNASIEIRSMVIQSALWFFRRLYKAVR